MNDTILRRCRILLAVAIFAVTGCRQTPVSSSAMQGAVSEGSDYLWPNAQADVCWEGQPSDAEFSGFAKLRSAIEDLVTSEYARAGFTFTGWGYCKPDSRGLRVVQWLEAKNGMGGRTEAFGRRNDGLFGGVAIMMVVEKGGGCPNPDYCVLTNALHEFGHAIGLRHEANRRDSPCAEDQTGGMGEEVVGMLPMSGYDPDSIMNYCSTGTGWNAARPPRLSDGDIATIKAYYSDGSTPRQDACRRDGHSWVADTVASCCRRSPSGRVPDSRPYEFCDSPYTIANGRRQLVTKVVEVLPPQLPWEAQLAIMRCKDGERVGERQETGPGPINPRGATDGGFAFWLRQGTEMGPQQVECTGIDFFDSREQNQARQVARYEFAPSKVFQLPSDPETIDLSGLTPKIAAVEAGANDLDGARSESPSAIPGASPVLPTKDGGLYIILEGLDPTIRVTNGTLFCDGEIIKASANEKADQAYNMFFLLPEDATGRRLTCQKVSAGMVKRTPYSPPQSNGPPPSPTFTEMNVEFKTPLVMKLGRVGYQTSFKVPACTLAQLAGEAISSETAKEQSVQTGDQISPQPGDQTAPPGDQVPTQPADQVPTQSADQVPTQPADQMPAQPADQVPAQPADQVPAQPADQVPAQPADQSGQPVDQFPAQGDAAGAMPTQDQFQQ